jgi:hypothetical protein
MKKIFLVLGIILIGIGVFWGIKYKFKLPDFSKWNPFGKSDLDITEERLLERLNDLERKSDSIAPILVKYQHTTDSLRKNDSLIDLKVLDLKQKDLLLEKKLLQSKDSLNKYRNNMRDLVKKYDEMKKNPKKSSNKDALDFFQKYK